MRNSERILKKQRVKIVGPEALGAFVKSLSVGTRILATIWNEVERRTIKEITPYQIIFATELGEKRAYSFESEFSDEFELKSKTFHNRVNNITYQILN